MTHPVEETLLAYIANQSTDEDRLKMDTHLADCPECSAHTRRLFALRADFDNIWNRWTASIHGQTAQQEQLDALLAEKGNPVVERARHWIAQISEGAELSLRILVDSGRRIATLAASALPESFEFEFRPAVAGVGSTAEDIKLDEHLQQSTMSLARNRLDDAVRELEKASKINPFVAQSAVSVLYRKGRKYAEVSADGRRGSVAIKYWPVDDGPQANFALLMPQVHTETPRVAELERVPGEEYFLAQFEDFRSGQFDLILGPCG